MIDLEDVFLAYPSPDAAGRRYAVEGLSLHIAAGELLVLLGESGCGKTTTLKMINRLIEPTSGTIRINGLDARRQDPVALRRTIGYVVQGSGLFPHMTVAENIAVVPRLLGWKANDIRRRVDELLALVKLPAVEYANRFPDRLSGGQQQRVGFARALAARPSVILLDEPFGALDPLVRDELRADFLRLRAEAKPQWTAVVVTHDMTEALLMADRIAVMKNGRLLRIGTPRELLARRGDDYVGALLHSPLEQTRQLETLLTGGAA
jgi:osmoprotectant transport system ATP-binding protein